MRYETGTDKKPPYPLMNLVLKAIINPTITHKEPFRTMPFAKGKSGNPGGRRKLTDSDRALLAGSTPHAIKRQIELMDDENGKVALLATNAVLDRYYGKPLQMVDIDANISDSDPYEGLTDDQIDKINAVYDEALETASEGNDGEPESA